MHEYKISHPEEFYSDWKSASNKLRNGRIKHWDHELKIAKIDLSKAQKEAKKCGID